MKIGFVNFCPFKYDVLTPYKKPLGGSESAMCYLSCALAKRGHDVTLFTHLNEKAKKDGVWCIPIPKITELINGFDVLIVQNSPLQGAQMRNLLNGKTKLVLWTQHATDQPAVAPLFNQVICSAFDAIVVISEWQKKMYTDSFPLEGIEIQILKNAISPAFENLPINKSKTPTLVYTSTPFRGLDLLLTIFPLIKKQVPDVKLRVFSSMQVYQVDQQTDQQNFGLLYEKCRNTEGIEYLGSVSQQQLAEELSKAWVLAYPNTFPETSCISVMEAMAAGLSIVTSNLAALPETTAGFGKLIKLGDWQKYINSFVSETVRYLKGDNTNEDQIQYANCHYNWITRSAEWEKWLAKIAFG